MRMAWWKMVWGLDVPNAVEEGIPSRSQIFNAPCM